MNLNYYNTFILVAEDSIADHGEIPNTKRRNKTVGEIQFELLNGHDYKYTQEEVLFETHMLHKNIPEEAREAEREAFLVRVKHVCGRRHWVSDTAGGCILIRMVM